MSDDSSRYPSFKIRQLRASDAPAYRELRLEGLRDHPEAFGASWEDEEGRELSTFVDRINSNVIFGGWSENSTLAGAVAYAVPTAQKVSHKGIIWGMYVRPDAQGTGLAANLTSRIIEHARSRIEVLQLSVVASNLAAIRLYKRLGFSQYGLEERALKIGDQYHDELLMALKL